MIKKLRNNMMKGLFVFLIFCSTLGSNLFVQAQNGSGTLKIIKSDDMYESIEGYCFGLYDNNSKDSEPIQYITLDETEVASIELNVGTYWIRRCNTPEDKVPDGSLKEIRIYDGQVTKFVYTEVLSIAAFANTRATYVTATRKNMGWYSPQFTNFALLYMSGTPVFCIQPHQLFSTADPYEIVYTKPNFISDATLRKISLASYYGTEYYKSDKWTATAQSLIWYYMGESWSSCIVDFKDGTTNESMMTTLNNIVNSHTTKPSFDGKTLSIEPGQTLTFEDTNGVLDRFTLTESISGVTVTKNGSTLTIKAESNAAKGTYSVSADNKSNIGKGTNTYYTTWGTSIHGSDGWQRCGKIYVASSDAVSSSFKIEVKESKGTLNLVKSSANTAITSNNNCYSLENAVYGVYSNSNCTTKVGELKTDASGKSNTLTLTAGTYYIKEITAPKNYKLDTTVYSVTVKSSTLTTKNVSDEPLSDPVRLLLGKVDKDTNSNKPSGSKSLQNAQFTFKFYLGDYAENVNPSTLGKTPTKTWVIKTDEDGYCRLGDSFKVSGDSFWYNANNEPTLPLGTLTVQETKAPEGYHINPEVFVIKIKPNSTTGVVTYNMPVVKEQAIQFKISKVQEGTSTVISSVKFAHTDPKGTVTNYTTNAQGKIVLDGLSVGTHSIKEVSTVEGYELNLSEFKFKINADGSVSSLSDVSNLFTIDENGNGVLKVENKVRPYSLKITKVNNYGVTLEGATFGLFSDKSCQNLIAKKQTSSTGELVFEGLRADTTYYLKELEAPDGYRLDDVVHVYEVSASSNPTKNEFIYYVDKTKYSTSNTSGPIHLEGTKDNRIISIEVVNQIGMQLPQTGSSQMVWLYAVTLGAFLISNYYRKKGEYLSMDTKKFVKKLSIAMLSVGMLFSGTISINSVYALQATSPSGVANLQDGGDASIVIHPNEGQSLIGKTFDVYKLFDAENSKNGESINYTMTEEYAPALKQVVANRKGINDPNSISEYVIIDYIQTLNNNVIEGAQAAQTLEGRYSDYRYFLEDVRDSLATLGIKAKHSVTVTQTQADGSFEITGLKYGYYLIDEVGSVQDEFSAASLIMVNTTNPSASINIKSDYPTILKKIYEDDNSIEWNDIADFEIGQTVPFKYESTLANMNGYHSYYYAFHDTMDSALTFHPDSIKIEIVDNTNDKSYTLKNNEFSVLTNIIAGETFLVEIEDIKAIVDREFPEEIDNLGHNNYDQMVVLTYNATLNDSAASRTGRAGFENDVYLEFSNNPDSDQKTQTGYPNSPITQRPTTGKTPIDTVVCFTYMVNGLKINNHDCPLEDAKFRLYSDKACTEEVYVKEGNNGYIVMNRDALGGNDHTGGSLSADAVEMISDTNGVFTIFGLDQGTYYLKETDSPAGYRELLDPIEIIITPTFTADRQEYVKGEGATDKTLMNLAATAEIKEFLSGMFDINKEDLMTNVQDGSLNITIVNTVGTKLPVTGSSMTVIMLGAGIALFAVAYVVNKKTKTKEN